MLIYATKLAFILRYEDYGSCIYWISVSDYCLYLFGEFSLNSSCASSFALIWRGKASLFAIRFCPKNDKSYSDLLDAHIVFHSQLSLSNSPLWHSKLPIICCRLCHPCPIHLPKSDEVIPRRATQREINLLLRGGIGMRGQKDRLTATPDFLIG